MSVCVRGQEHCAVRSGSSASHQSFFYWYTTVTAFTVFTVAAKSLKTPHHLLESVRVFKLFCRDCKLRKNTGKRSPFAFYFFVAVKGKR